MKVMIKNPMFIISILFNIFLIYKQYSVLQYSIFEFSQVFYFGFIASNLFFIVISTYITYKNYDILNFIEKSILEKQLAVIIASIIISTITSLIPILIMIIFKSPNFQHIFVLKGIIHFFIIWTLSNLLACVVGSTIGTICKNGFSIILSFAFFALFIKYSYGSYGSYIKQLFNIYDDFTFAGMNYICGRIFNTFYYLDKLFILLISLLILSINCFINKRIKKTYSTIFLILTLICTCINVHLSSIYKSSNLTQYEPIKNINYIVESYDMDIKLDNKFKNAVNINLSINTNSNNLVMLLDDLFKIDELYVNGKLCEFHHDYNKLNIIHSFTKGDKVKISIKYEGNVNVATNLGAPVYYASKYASNLPISSFYWYPKASKTSLINFNVSIKSSGSIYSNLDMHSFSNDIYTFRGKSSGLNIFSGQYKKYYENNIEYIIPTNLNLESFKLNMQKYINNLNSKHFSKKELAILKTNKFKKVICGTWDINFNVQFTKPYIQIFEDTLIINY